MFNHQYRYINLATLLSYLQNREIQVSLFWMVFSNCDNIRLSNGLITPQSCYNYLFNGLFVHFHSLQNCKRYVIKTTIRKQISPQKDTLLPFKYSGNMKSGPFWILNGRKEVGLQMVQISNAI